MTGRAPGLAALSILLGLAIVSCGGDGPVALSEISVTPGQVSLTFLGATQSLTATITDESGSTRTDVELQWSSNNTGAVSVSSAGVVTAMGSGTATIQASAGGVTSNPVSVTVDQTVTSLQVSGGNLAFSFLGESARLTATAQDEGGAEVTNASLTWTSTNLSVASVASDGTVTAAGNGSTTVRASADGASSNAVSVSVAQVASEVSITGPGSLSFTSLGETEQLSVDARDAGGSLITNPAVVWSTSDPSVVEVAQDGTVSAVGNGSAEISARVDDASSGTIAVAVDQVITAVTVDRTVLNIPDVGGTAQLTATARDAKGNPVEDAEYGWESSDIGVVSVETTGRTVTVTGVAEGMAEVTARSGDVVSGPTTVGVVTPATPELVSGEGKVISASNGEQQFFLVHVPEGSGEIFVGTGGGSGSLRFYLRFGELPTEAEYDCVSGGTTLGLCEGTYPTPGDWFVLVDATPSYSQVNINALVRAGPPGLNIDFIFDESVPQNVQDLARSAADRWEALLPTELGGHPFLEYPSACDTLMAFDVAAPVEDLLIKVEVVDLGSAGTLARAFPCLYRSSGSQAPLPAVGGIQIDDDALTTLGSEALEQTLTHELGHVLGFGSLWDFVSPSLIQGAGGSDPIFVGPLARQAFDDVGGTEYGGAKVPLENTGGEGARDGHWRESVFDNELMTPYIETNSTEKLSIVTVQAMADLGWTVNLSLADDYTLPGSSGAAARAGARERIHLLEDIPRLEMHGIDTGRWMGLFRPRGH